MKLGLEFYILYLVGGGGFGETCGFEPLKWMVNKVSLDKTNNCSSSSDLGIYLK